MSYMWRNSISSIENLRVMELNVINLSQQFLKSPFRHYYLNNKQKASKVRLILTIDKSLSSYKPASAHLPLYRSMEGSTRWTKKKLSSPPRGKEWLFFESAAGWAPGQGTPQPWRGQDPCGGGWPPGRCARSRTLIWAPRIWWTSSLRLWMLTSWLQMNASLRPLMHRSSSSNDPPGWTFGTLGLLCVEIVWIN